MSHNVFGNTLEEPNLELFIETLTGTTFELKVYPHDTILDIKKKIQRVEGIPVHHQNLLFRLEEIEDYRRLCDIGVVSGSKLKLVLSMRGGPISTRRLSACDHHLLWKDLKDLIDNTREEFGDKLNAGLKVSVLIFRDGDIINLIRVIENEDGSFNTFNDKPLSSPSKLLAKENGQTYYNKIEENNAMSLKLIELRKKMAEVCLRRHFKNSKPMDLEEIISIGCIGEKPNKSTNDHPEEAKNDDSFNSSIRYHLLQKFKKDAESLLKLHESQFDDEDDDDEDLELYDSDSEDDSETLQMCEDSIALKEKHRGKNSFCNILFQNPRFSNEKQQWKPQKLPSKESRERTSFYLKHNESTLKNLKLKPKTSSEIGNNIMKMSEGKFPEVRKIEDRQNNFINSPLYSRFNNSSYCRNRKQDGKLSLPKVMSPTTIVDENLKTKESTLVSPIGVLPFAGAVSMSKVPAHKGVRLTPLLVQDRTDRPKSNPEAVNLEDSAQEFCDICSGESSESFHGNELGLLKRWQSVDCSAEEVCNSGSTRSPINFKESCDSSSDLEVVDRDYFLPSLFPTSPGTIPSQYGPNKDCVGDLFFGNRINEERISRCPLYRRYSQSGNFSVESDNFAKSSDNHRKHINECSSIWEAGTLNESESRPNERNSNCDNLNGTLYNLINGGRSSAPESDRISGKIELNPVRIRGDSESKKLEEEIKKTLFSIRNDCRDKNINKIEVNTSKLDNLPAIITKKRMRCGACNKKLNITNMYDCRCGKIFCGQHRYSEVHGCNYDYKTEGRKLLEQQNPLIIAEKLNKL